MLVPFCVVVVVVVVVLFCCLLFFFVGKFCENETNKSSKTKPIVPMLGSSIHVFQKQN